MSTTSKARAARRRGFVPSLIVLLLALTMILPFLWMLSTSLMGELEVYQFPPKFFPSTSVPLRLHAIEGDDWALVLGVSAVLVLVLWPIGRRTVGGQV